MNTELHSEYYDDPKATEERYEMPAQALPFLDEAYQTVEEQLFGFLMYLIS